jgi:hypothetical protein
MVESANMPSRVIFWRSGRNLQWDNFQGAPQPETGVDAVSSCGILCEPTVINNYRLQFQVSCYFSVEHSWVDDEDASGALLQHEQGHFDVGEIYARRLRKRLSEMHFNRNNLNAQIQKAYDDVFEDYKKAQDRYDRESRHSTLKHAQAGWERWIARELKRLEEYDTRYLEVPVY